MGRVLRKEEGVGRGGKGVEKEGERVLGGTGRSVTHGQ